LIVSNANPHFGEEPPLVGRQGSGTIFLTNCNLSCVFCQNYEISHLSQGKIVSIEQLAALMLSLQYLGCHNINLVTPTHFTAHIVKALAIAAENGLTLPIVYNCGGYESVDVLIQLDEIVDIYMPDFKYWDDENAFKYSGVRNYREYTKNAFLEMQRQVGDLKMDSSGIAYRGLLIRHLVLPNNIAGTENILHFIADKISKDSYVNIMDQYRPCFQAWRRAEINRRITREEYILALKIAYSIGLRRGFELPLLDK
jgi:putative pyruvate formate lyase activating enzyme